jgi:hypothetical protein
MSRPEPPPPWSVPLRLAEVGRLPQPMRLEPDAAARTRIAAALDLVDLPAFAAEVRLRPWLDGVELEASWKADVVYRCGVTVDPFDEALKGRFSIRAVRHDSPHATPAEETDEIEIDLDADDPPDVLDNDILDVGAYLVEHLALELDPFPRKPGAVFEPPPVEGPESPFAVLRVLKSDKNDDETP